MSEAPLVPIVTETTIKAPIAQVWEVLTGEATVPHWLGCMDYERRVGATFFMQQDPELRAKRDTTGATHCTISLLDRPNKFVFSWFQPGTPETVVEFHLFEDGKDATLVRLIHDGWDQFPADAIRPFYDQLKADWRGSLLPSLKRATQKS